MTRSRPFMRGMALLITLLVGSGGFRVVSAQDGGLDLGTVAPSAAVQTLDGKPADLAAVIAECPRGCTHASVVPECGLDEAVADRRTDPERVESFRRLLDSREQTV